MMARYIQQNDANEYVSRKLATLCDASELLDYSKCTSAEKLRLAGISLSLLDSESE